jgi:tetratricopeptide (TPR) repeat protein
VALELLSQPNYDDDSVRHLIELGYVDPDVTAAREVVVRRELEAEFQLTLKQYERGELAEAARQFEKLAIDDRNWVAPRQLLAETYYRIGDLESVASQLEWLTLHAVEHPRLALISGALALASRNMPEALDALRYAAHVEPELPSVHTLLGTVHFRLGNLEASKTEYQQALEQRPTDAHALDGLAAIHLRESNFADAADSALAALEQDMQLFRAHYHLGVALAHLDRPNDAITALETSTKVNPNSAAPYYWLARIAERQLADLDLARRYRQNGRDRLTRRRDAAQRHRAL